MNITTAKVMDVADTVYGLLTNPPAAFIGSQSFVTTFDCAVSFQPLFDMEDLRETVKVPVVPSTENDTVFQRQTSDDLIDIDVGIMFQTNDDTVRRQLMLLAEQFKELLKLPNTVGPQVLASGGAMVWRGMTARPLWSPDQILEKNVFQRILTFTYSTRLAR